MRELLAVFSRVQMAALPFISALLAGLAIAGVAIPLALAKPIEGMSSKPHQRMNAVIEHLHVTARYRLDYPADEPVQVARVGKDQSRFLKEDPWVVHVIPTISFTRQDYERAIALPRPRPKGKRSELNTDPVSLQTPFGVTIKTRVSLSGIPSTLTNHLKNVQAKCGTVTVTSAFRPGARVAGSRRMSCHAVKQAIDYTISNPSCALMMAKQWRGGHSIDYHTAPGGRHFHISTCRQEAGARFAHRGGRSYSRTRYARNKPRHIRVARAN